MNSRDGGTLLIGIADDGTVHGIESDYESRSKKAPDPRDWFQLHLANIIAASVGEAAATNVRLQILSRRWTRPLSLQVDPAGFPVDATVTYQKPNQPKETRTEFFVRIANGTKALGEAEREKFIVQRWGKKQTGIRRFLKVIATLSLRVGRLMRSPCWKERSPWQREPTN